MFISVKPQTTSQEGQCYWNWVNQAAADEVIAARNAGTTFYPPIIPPPGSELTSIRGWSNIQLALIIVGSVVVVMFIILIITCCVVKGRTYVI